MIVPGEPVEQSPATATVTTGPGDNHEITFGTYTPEDPARGVLQPPDPTGADGALDTVLMVGKSYLLSRRTPAPRSPSTTPPRSFRRLRAGRSTRS
ncbi:MAG: hypothetical protein OEW29_00590 [Acidimicrobiia bacterium]|nr:hypothetical protein [Acidimicrobiia bacterium]MDH4364407.1 hypothetical protein [Acidimicrobiia bacterium]